MSGMFQGTKEQKAVYHESLKPLRKQKQIDFQEGLFLSCFLNKKHKAVILFRDL